MGLEDYLRFALAFLFVMALILGIAWGVRRFGLAGPAMPGVGRKRRVNIVESVVLDAKRRVVMIRCDDSEYLVLLGQGNDLVLKSDKAAPIIAAVPGGQAAGAVS
jgi:flagellar protein FliO/FliZ